MVYQQNSKESATLQPFFTLQLDIQSEKIRTVQEALETLVARESVQGYTSKTKQEVWIKNTLSSLVFDAIKLPKKIIKCSLFLHTSRNIFYYYLYYISVCVLLYSRFCICCQTNVSLLSMCPDDVTCRWMQLLIKSINLNWDFLLGIFYYFLGSEYTVQWVNIMLQQLVQGASALQWHDGHLSGFFCFVSIAIKPVLSLWVQRDSSFWSPAHFVSIDF